MPSSACARLGHLHSCPTRRSSDLAPPRRGGHRGRMAPSHAARSTSSDRRSGARSEEHTSELQSRGHLVCRLLLAPASDIYTPALHDALPILPHRDAVATEVEWRRRAPRDRLHRTVEAEQDRKSTRLNSSHVATSYAVFCLRPPRTSTLLPYTTLFRSCPTATRWPPRSNGAVARREIDFIGPSKRS